jgi:hypothetical protein
VRLVSPIGGATGGSGNLSASLPNVARLAAHPKFVWVFNANCDGTIIYNDPVPYVSKNIWCCEKQKDLKTCGLTDAIQDEQTRSNEVFNCFNSFTKIERSWVVENGSYMNESPLAAFDRTSAAHYFG